MTLTHEGKEENSAYYISHQQLIKKSLALDLLEYGYRDYPEIKPFGVIFENAWHSSMALLIIKVSEHQKVCR